MVVAFEEALRLVASAARGLAGSESLDSGRAAESVALLECVGRVLAKPLSADRDQPAFDRSTRDGFAVRVEELAQSPLRIVGEVRAGEVWQGKLPDGAAIAIMTGAPVPLGANAVVMIEHVRRSGDRLALIAERGLRAGENIVPQGSEAGMGEVLLAAGTRMGAAEIALAAACGQTRLPVYRRPRVAIVATGDELVELDETPDAQQIRNSNSYALAALVTAAGGEAVRLPIAPDTLDGLRSGIAQGRAADLLVLSGGVSMGAYDLVEEILAEAGAAFLFTGVRMQPGKPVVFGRFREGGYFFGLPGNPISTQVTFQCFAETMVRALGGESVTGPRWGLARLAAEVAAQGPVTRLLPCRLDDNEAAVVRWQGSGDLAANARANACVELLPGQDHAAGALVRVLLR